MVISYFHNIKHLLIIVIILFSFLLTPFKLNAMNDTKFDVFGIYNHVKDHADLVNVLPDEMGISFPVPLIQDDDMLSINMAFFHFYMNRINKKSYNISSPRHKTIVNYFDGIIVETYAANSASFGVEWDDSKPVGEYIPEPDVSYEQQVKIRKRFFELYNIILPLYINKNNQLNENNKELIFEYKTIFYKISHLPLLPYYKSLNPDFFKWLEKSSN